MLKEYNDIKVMSLDKLTYASNLENLKTVESNANYTFAQEDICDSKLIEELFNKYDTDYIVSFGLKFHADRSILEPEVFVETNVLGTVILLNVAKNVWS